MNSSLFRLGARRLRDSRRWLAVIAPWCWALARAADPPGVVIDYSPAASGIYIGSPSLAVLTNGDYVASHDEFGPRSTEETWAVTKMFGSRDHGQTWTALACVE